MSPAVPRVLIVAESANPEWVSVPLEGWSHSRAIAQLCDAHVVTQIRNVGALERSGWQNGREFTALDTESTAAPLHRAMERLRRATGLGWTVTTAFAGVSYYHFEYDLVRRFGPDLDSGKFDLVHRVTPLSPTTPSYFLARRCRRSGVPFVLGPLNGGVPWPPGYAHVQRAEGEWLAYVRGAHKLMPGYRSTRQLASALIAGSMSVWEQLRGFHDKCVYIPENAIDPERFTSRCRARDTAPLRVAFVGRLVPYKGADILLEAAAPLIHAKQLVVDIIGDGPEKPRLLRLAEELAIRDGVLLDGWIAHEQLAQRLGEAQIFGFPSLREFGGAVVLEAMALGLVPVVVGYAGPDELVTDGTGFRIPVGPRPVVVERLREVLGGLARQPGQLAAVSERARRRVLAHFTWEAKARHVLEVYRWVLGERAKPDFGMPLPDPAED
jgi:glycosyltransferase involved in cell wall biosynthesis